jgi:hypothetical protein
MALWVYCAWATYELKPAGWWLMFATFAVFTVSSVLTFARIDPTQMYVAMGYPAQDVRAIASVPLFRGHAFGLIVSATMVPFIAYFIWIKKYFN